MSKDNKSFMIAVAFSITASFIATLFITAPLQAQEADDSAEVLVDQIVVTARRRDESLQDIPESVTVFSADQIERAGISSLRDVADLTPNLSQLDNYRPGLARIQVRGVITPQVGDAPIAYVVDGVTAPDLEFMNQELFDIERIEVLRGAQGALYGRGAIGGAVNIVTKKPTNEFETRAVLSASNGDGSRGAVTVSGALTEDKVFYRIGAYSQKFDGQIKDSFQKTEVDYHNETSTFGKLLFDISGETSLDVNARYTTTDSGLGYYERILGDNPANLENFSNGPHQNVVGNDERSIYEISTKYETELDIGTWELVAAISDSDQKGFSDSDYTALAPDYDNFFYTGAQETRLKVESATIESRLTSPSDQQLRWALAAFYQDRKRDSTFRYYNDFDGTVLLRQADFGDAEESQEILDENNSEAWALAAQLNYDIADDMELTAALRYDEDERDSTGSLREADPDTFVYLPAVIDRPKKTYSELQPKISLAYHSAPNTLLYGGYSRGFRSGGFNEPHPTISRIFDKETSDSFELGFKTTLPNGATLNGAIFQIDQDNAQITQFNGKSFTLENITIDDVSSKGIEFEYAAWLSDDVRVGLNGGIIDSEINAFADRPELVGKSVPHVADYNAAANIEWTTPLANGRELAVRGDIQHVGPRSLSIVADYDALNIESSERTFINLRASLETETGSLTVYANDITDERQVEDVIVNQGLYRQASRKPRFGIEYRTGF